MADMQELIARLEAAEAGSAELDYLIYETFSDWRNIGGGFAAHKVTGERRVNHFDVTATYTTSLDAALALAEWVFPGWYVGVQPWFHTDPDRVMSRAYLIRPDWKLWNPVGDDWCDQHHGRSCATPALAVVAAILRAVQHGYEGAESGEVSPNLKAKAQGEGG